MAFINQKGFAPIAVVIGLLALGALASGGTYFYLKNQQPEPIVQPVEQKVPFPSVNFGSSIEQVKDLNEESLLAMKGVEKVEVKEFDKKPCIVVFTYEQTDDLMSLEHKGLGGYKVVVLNNPTAQ